MRYSVHECIVTMTTKNWIDIHVFVETKNTYFYS